MTSVNPRKLSHELDIEPRESSIAHHEPPPGTFVSIAANRAIRAHEAEIQWDIGHGRQSTIVPFGKTKAARLERYLEDQYVRDQIYEWASRCSF